MKIQEQKPKVNTEENLIASYDVASEKADFYSEIKMDGKDKILRDTVKNTIENIKSHFLELDAIALQLGYKGIHVFFESTGGFENILKEVALQKKYRVNYVSGEATKKASVIEGNETSKSDDKDCRIIFTLARMSKILTCRNLCGEYKNLRELGSYYEDVSLSGVPVKNKISKAARSLFPGLNFKSKFIYSATGKYLQALYGFNPHRITKYSFSTFVNRMKKNVPKCNKEVLKTVYRKAGFAISIIGKSEASLHEKQLKWLYEQYIQITKQKKKLKVDMTAIYETLPESEKLNLVKDVSSFQFARIIAETGPLADFQDSAQVTKYAGLNIKIKESGKYKGQSKISKKGRALLRKILYQTAVISLVKKDRLYSDYFNKKKKQKENGIEALVAVMRKFLKMMFGVAISKHEFDIKRVHMSQKEYEAYLQAA